MPYMDSFYKGLDNLNDTFARVRAEDRQAGIDDLNAQASRQQLAMGAIQLQNAQRDQSDRQAAIEAANNIPTTRTALYDQMGPSPPIPNPDAATTRQELQRKLDNLRGAANLYDNIKPGSSSDLQPTIADMQAKLAAVPDQVEGAPLPSVQVEQQVPITDADRMGAMIKSYIARGNIAKAKELFGMADEFAKTQGEMNATGTNDRSDYYTKLTKATLDATKLSQIEKGLTTVASLAKEGPQYLKMAEPAIKSLPGFENFTADAVTVDPTKRFTTIDAGNGQTIVIDNLNPKDWKLEKKDPVSDFSSFHAAGIAEGKTERQITDAWHKQKMEEMIAGKQASAKITVDARGHMSDDAVTLAAQNYLLTGQMPALGMGGATAKMMVLNKAAQLAKEQGLDARGIQSQIAEIKASGGALKNDEKQYDLMHKAELQAQGAAKLLRQSSANYGRTNIKFVNSVEALAREAAQDPKLADLQMKLLAFGREYYKVTTNAYASSTELSVGAQAAADKMLNASNSWAALEAKISAAEQEMSNTNKTFLQTISDRKKQIRGGASSQEATPTAYVYDPKTGTLKPK